MNYESLTNYDKYVLAQNNNFSGRLFAESEPAEPAFTATVMQEQEDLYEKYLINELRRTVPSDRPVMREEEFYAQLNGGNQAVAKKDTYVASAAEREKDEYWRRLVDPYGTKNEKVERPKRSFAKFKFPKLTKMGKIVLAVYVIMILAVASILIVSNTTVTDVNFHESANASQEVESEENPSVIRAMTIEEEEEEHSDWFDQLCDSLNK